MATLPPLADLLNTIDTSLASLPTNLTTQSAGGDIFEAYVFALIIDASESEGGNVSFRNRDGSVPANFLFRSSPGHLYSTAHNYTYARIQFPNVPLLEAHLGVYVSGKSQLIHEADVVVLVSSEGDMSRANSVPPRSHRCVLTVECKFYASNISLFLGRGFVGLCSDLSARESFFVTNSTSNSVQKLLVHKRLKWESQLQPIQAVNVERFRNAVQEVFKDYKAKYA
jgi:hypothetical protein